MNLTYYTRLVGGGIETHIRNLSSFFNPKILAPKGFFLPRGYYIIDPHWKLIKKEIENCDIFHIHHPATSSELLIPLLVKNIKKKASIISTFHTPVGELKYSKICNNYIKLITKLYSKISAKFVAVGVKQKEIIENIVKEKVILVNNGVDINKFKKKKVKRPFNDFTIGFLGRLDPEKNIFSLIKACKNINVNLVIAGRGIYYKKIKKMENKKLKIIGFVKNPVEFYNSIDVFASISYLEAGIPYTILEAMACGIPIITSACGGEEPNLEDGGIICGTKVGEIENAILEIRKLDLEQLGKKARKIVEKKYNLKTQIEKHKKLYNSLLK